MSSVSSLVVAPSRGPPIEAKEYILSYNDFSFHKISSTELLLINNRETAHRSSPNEYDGEGAAERKAKKGEIDLDKKICWKKSFV